MIIETMGASPQQRALEMDEVLFTIYGFALGTNMNTIVKKMRMCLVSLHFKKCFIAYLRSVPLKLRYNGHKTGPIVQWMKRYDMTRLFGLAAYIHVNNLVTFNRDFSGFDFSNLSVLDLTIYTMNPSRTNYSNQVQSLHSLFTEAVSLTHLKLSDNTLSNVSYEDFLSHFPILKSLDVDFGSPANAEDPDGASRASEEALHLERLVRHNLYGNFSLCSESLKILDVHSMTLLLDSIPFLDCPCLEELICQNPIIIGGISGSALAEEYGNSNREFITSFLETFEHKISSSDIETIASISIVPPDCIEGNDSFQVGSDCRIILITFND